MSGWVIAVALISCAALALRRRAPLAVLATTTLGAAGSTLLATDRTPLVVTALLALYTVAAHTSRRTTLLSWALTALTLTSAALLRPRGATLTVDLLSYSAWTGLAAAVGDAYRNRRAYVGAIEERAVRAEQSREQEALRRVAEERLRIARELHDVVAHHMAVVNVQAGVAAHLLASNPVAADEALVHVRTASRAVLDELTGILSVLREPRDGTDPAPPAPGLAQLETLKGSFAAVGLEVDWSVDIQPHALGPAVDLVAYRVLQEALTNAHKHGTGTALVVVRSSPSALTLSVSNPLGRTPVSHAGYGLTGMRERAAAVGGRLHAGLGDDGRFHLDVELPLRAAALR